MQKTLLIVLAASVVVLAVLLYLAQTSEERLHARLGGLEQELEVVQMERDTLERRVAAREGRLRELEEETTLIGLQSAALRARLHAAERDLRRLTLQPTITYAGTDAELRAELDRLLRDRFDRPTPR